MITPDFLSYEMNLLKTHNELKESILRDVTRRIVKTGYVTDTAKYQAEKLQQCGVIYDDVINLVSEKTNETKSEIKRIFDDAKTEVFNYDDELIIDAGYEVLEVKNISPRMKRIINAAVKKTTTEAINLTKTTAITSQSLYISACDLAHQQIVSGAFTYTQAIKNAVISASKQGVNVVYPSGHISSLYSAVRRSVLTGVNQTYGKLQNMRAGELEIDIMELTAHMGARPEHSVWQGQLVSLSGQEGYLTTDDIGYGDVRGFMGANCRHNWHMFFPGSQRAYTQDELDTMRDTNVTYNGETIPYSEAVQKQRSMERGISKIKDSLVCIDEARKNAESDELKGELNIEFSNLSVKLKKKENKLKDFTNQTGLKRDKFREQVFSNETGKGYGKSVSAKAVWDAQKYYDTWRKSIGADDTPKTLEKYYNMKYNNKKEFELLQAYAHSVENGKIKPLTSYSYYKKAVEEIENTLVGVTTSNGITITGQTKHFAERVIGGERKSERSIKKYPENAWHRQGVDINDVKDALVNGTLKGDVKRDGKNRPSIKLGNEKCSVTINPDTGILIQTNPEGK